MAALGNCPAAGNFATATPYIVVNEVSTVAAAYAMAGFATDALHVGSSGTTLAQTGIANAFANAANLETIGTGVALATTPAGNGTVPQAEINTLANILAACVNSNGSLVSPAPCYELGLATRVSSFDTAKAAISIAHSPATNVSSLYALSPSTPPFAPALTAQPKDWTVSIAYTGGGLSSPYGIAIDGAGNAWVLNNASGMGSELTSSGVWSSFPAFFAQSFIAIDPSGNVWIAGNSGLLELNGGFFPDIPGAPTGIAIDGSGNIWMSTDGRNSGVSELTNTGSLLGSISGASFGMSIPWGIAVDSSGNTWVPDFQNNTVLAFSSAANGGSGNTFTPGGGLSHPNGIAIDGSGNAWIVSVRSIIKLSNSGTLLSGASGYGTNLYPQGIAFDGRGYAWITNMGSSPNYNLLELTNTGIAVGSSGGLLDLGSSTSVGPLAVDGSGDVWMTLPNTNTMLDVIGAATPVVTPISVGVKNNMLGMRP
jgi:hypothetical protein